MTPQKCLLGRGEIGIVDTSLCPSHKTMGVIWGTVPSAGNVAQPRLGRVSGE